jgi:hypothetical protein
MAARRDYGKVTRMARRRWPAVLLLVCVAGAVLSACAVSARVAQSTPWWASVQKPDAARTAAFRHVPGSSSYRCVGVGHYRDVRSGGFMAGPFGIDEQLFAEFYQQYRLRNEIKVYWIPLHVDHMTTLTVHATLLAAQSMSRTVKQSQVATVSGEVFYPSAVPIPVPGTWELTASAGPNRGCFIVTFPPPAPR